MVGAGHTWKDSQSPGGGVKSAMTVLNLVAIAGQSSFCGSNSKGPTFKSWGDLGFLTNLMVVAKAGEWMLFFLALLNDYNE